MAGDKRGKLKSWHLGAALGPLIRFGFVAGPAPPAVLMRTVPLDDLDGAATQDEQIFVQSAVRLAKVFEVQMVGHRCVQHVNGITCLPLIPPKIMPISRGDPQLFKALQAGHLKHLVMLLKQEPVAVKAEPPGRAGQVVGRCDLGNKRFPHAKDRLSVGVWCVAGRHTQILQSWYGQRDRVGKA